MGGPDREASRTATGALTMRENVSVAEDLRTEAQRLLESLEDELAAVDLEHLPPSVVTGLAVGRSNGDGLEIPERAVRIMVLRANGTITDDQSIALLGIV